MRRVVATNLGETLDSPAAFGETRIHLCGRMTVRIFGCRLEEGLPGRQGRMLFAYLAAHRQRLVDRSELLDVLWPDEAPGAAESGLAALLAKLRRALGAGALEGKHDIRLVLPPDAWIDLEAARDGLHRAEGAIGVRDWARAWGPARVATHIASRTFLPGYQSPWVESVRRELQHCLMRAHECVAVSCLGLGGSELATADRAAAKLVEVAPLRETGYRLLMQVAAARGDVAEALSVYEQLRTVLREELGASPGPLVQALHRQLLRGSDPSPVRADGPARTE